MNTTIIEREIDRGSISIKAANLADWLISHGKVTITTSEAAQILGVPEKEVPQRLMRFRKKGQFVALGRGLWVVVSPEYREMGAPEPMKYIDAMMSFYGHDYCVGWLSAAALQGARHQAPQVFQVAVDSSVRGRTIGRSKLEFYNRSNVCEISKKRITTSAGSAMVATPGVTMLMTAADVIISSGIDNVATVITELAEENEDYLPDIIENANRFPYSAVCRLGWMLEHVAEESSLDELEDYCQRGKSPVMLSPHDGRSGRIDKRWNIIENRLVEADI